MLGALLVATSLLAGCAGSEEPPATAPTKASSGTGAGASAGAGSPATVTPSPAPPRGTSERWHFHDYWQGSPTIVLYEGDITFNLTPTSGDGLPTMNAIVDLPHGTIVPPETGYLTMTVGWDAGTPGGLVNITYKPADSNDFHWAGDAASGLPIVLNTTESNCDVPHRQSSAWRFNLTAKPGGAEAPGLPPQTFRFNITATIGRPLFIDPPHLDWWRAGDTIPLVSAASGIVRSANTPAGNATVPDPGTVQPPAVGEPSVPPERPGLPVKPDDLSAAYRVPIDAGRIVPEGTKTVLAMLNWTTQTPDGKLSLRYRENNLPSEGAMELLSEAPGARIYVLKPAPAQTDTTYSNRTTWEFIVTPEGAPVAAFEGSFTLVAWASRLEPAAALAEVTASA